MKRILYLLMLALLLIPGVFSLAEQVDTYSWNDADVDFNAETGMITAYHGMAAYLAIPAEIDGATVKSIGPSVFAENETLIGIILPEGLETVEEAAFSHCASLTRAEFPATLQKIYAKAFDGCEALQEIHLKIEDARIAIFAADVFAGCTSLSQIVVEGECPETYAWLLQENVAGQGLNCEIVCETPETAQSTTVPEDYVGTWHGVSIGNGEMAFQLADVGMFAVFTIHEDGLMERNSNGEKDEVRCVMIAGVLTVEDEGTTLSLEDGMLVMRDPDVEMRLEKE